MPDINAKERLLTEFNIALAEKTLKKEVFSKCRSGNVLRLVFTPFEKNGRQVIKSESFMRDGKALQKILDIPEAAEFVKNEACELYKQIDLVGKGAALGLLISDKGKTRFTGSLKGAEKLSLCTAQDAKKNYIISPETDKDFLYALGVCDGSGRIHDKKQSKFRQINKFIEQIEAVSGALPSEGELTVCDLCCGKSYLTFAVYRYFTFHKKRAVKMYGIDLKSDCIDYCREVASTLGFDGMFFECGDVSEFRPPRAPDMVISLHACDIATDFAIAGAIKSGAKVILSTPCCQHELSQNMSCRALDFVCEHSILKQKIASAMTDAIRAKLLQIHGYNVTVCELIDPEETPKNVIIRAVKGGRRMAVGDKIKELEAAIELIGYTPKIVELLK